MSHIIDIPKANDIYMIDTNQFGIPRYGASFIVDARKKALVETGTSHAVPKIVSGLTEVGIDSDELSYIFLTHLHLDHAGGAGFLANRYPNAKIVVNNAGASHLIDPSYLVKSVKEAVGEMFKHYGGVKPIPKNRVVNVSGKEVFDLGDEFEVETIDTPGHAPHHTCFYESRNKALFAGDACGIYLSYKDILLPTTPPPSFSLESSLDSLKKLTNLDLRMILFTHFGPAYRPQQMLRRYADLLEEWVDKIAKARGKFVNDQQIKDKLMKEYEPLLRKIDGNDNDLKKGITMDVDGVLLYLDRRKSKDKG